jgi:hypothetical protein
MNATAQVTNTFPLLEAHCQGHLSKGPTYPLSSDGEVLRSDGFQMEIPVFMTA